MAIERSLDGMAIYSHMAGHIEQVTQRWLPALAATGKVPPGVPRVPGTTGAPGTAGTAATR